MKRVLLFLPILALAITFVSGRPATGAPGYPDPPGHEAWNKLVGQHVYPNGTVNYNGFARDREVLDSYISTLEKNPPAGAWSREEKLAYYINLYNAATIRLILDHFPIESIMRIGNPWGQNILNIGGVAYNLNNIEHDILRKMGDPRIHFAINCASTSCPVLQPFAFTADKMESQLDRAAREFINDPGRNAIGGDKAELSKIFKWYKEDFTESHGSLVAYLNQYLEEPLPEGAKIGYLAYDWSLNRP